MQSNLSYKGCVSFVFGPIHTGIDNGKVHLLIFILTTQIFQEKNCPKKENKHFIKKEGNKLT